MYEHIFIPKNGRNWERIMQGVSEHSKMKSKMEINRLGTNNRTQFSSWVPESLAGRENPKFLKISSPSKLPMLKTNTRVKIISKVRLEVTSSLKLFPYLIGSLLQLTVKILAILWLTITFFPLWWNFNFTVNFFPTNGYNLQIFTRNGLINPIENPTLVSVWIFLYRKRIH